MTQKGINPLYISALDILLNTLGVFIILNFLNARLTGAPPVPANPAAKEQKEQKDRQNKPVADVKPRPAGSNAWWRKPRPGEPAKPQTPPSTSGATPKPENNPSASSSPPTPPQDPVAVDLMKQTKGAVVILLQQEDQARASVEFMLRQGNRTWKPTRASKYQNSDFQYEKALAYFYQAEIQPGSYEVLVRLKKGQRNGGPRPFSLYGKLIPPGQKTQTYSFGTFSANEAGSDWVSAGIFRISAGALNYQSRIPAASKTENNPASAEPAPAKTNPERVRKPTGGKAGKWGK